MIQNNPNKLIVNEIFYSIQGESTLAGLPCVFVRLTYCNIRCTYCDSAYAFYEGEEMSIEQILDRIKMFGCKIIEVTGGEPLFQSNAGVLLTRLCDEGYDVLLETGGSLSIADVDSRVKCIVDFKCPSSGMVKKNLWSIAGELKRGDEVKFVIGSREDYEWAKQKLVEYSLAEKCTILMSVVFGMLTPLELAEWILADKLHVRFQLQMHKFIWHPDARGV